MNKLVSLLNELCPKGVKYYTLNELNSRKGDLFRGIRICKRDLVENGLYPVYGGGSDEIFGLYDKYNVLEDTVTVNVAGSVGFVDYIKQKSWIVDSRYAFLSNRINHKFLYYYLKSMQRNLESFKKGAIPGINMSKLLSVNVPVPPLPIQEEIVRILDNFTELTAELTAELQDRKKQYEYYRDNLLTFDNKVQYLSMEEIAKFTYGFTDSAKETGNYRYVRITDISEEGNLIPINAKYIADSNEAKKYLLKQGDLLLVRTGATYGKTLFFDFNEPSVYASFLIKIDLNNDLILNRYYWHFSKSSLYWQQANKYVSKAGQQQFNTGAISKVIVPIPSLEIQRKIIDVLDNFEKICNDLKIGLPAEIELRQKQYEYYRNMLLTFPENDLYLSKQASKQASIAITTTK